MKDRTPLMGPILVSCGLALLGIAAGQAMAADKDHFHHHHVGLFAGGMTPLSAKDATSFALGIDYEYRVDGRWGAGAGAEAVFGDHDRAALVSTAVTYRPVPPFRLGTGPGFEVVEKDQPGGATKTTPYFLWGFSAAYLLHVGSLSLAPTVMLDFVGETKTNLTYGITVGTGF